MFACIVSLPIKVLTSCPWWVNVSYRSTSSVHQSTRQNVTICKMARWSQMQKSYQNRDPENDSWDWQCRSSDWSPKICIKRDFFAMKNWALGWYCLLMFASVFFCICRSAGVCVCACVCVCDTIFMGMAAGVMYIWCCEMIVSVMCMHISCVDLCVHVFMNPMQSWLCVFLMHFNI